MGKLVVSEFVSLDGVMEAPGGEPGYAHTDWVSRTPHGGHFSYKLEEIQEHDALLVGRVTYESFAGAWPERSGAFAEKVNTMPKFVVSNTMDSAAWNNTTVLKGDAADSVAKLKREFDGTILVHGSHQLVTALKEAGLVDEYRLMVFPVVLGSGFRMFDDWPDEIRLELVDTRCFDTGVVVLSYRPAVA